VYIALRRCVVDRGRVAPGEPIPEAANWPTLKARILDETVRPMTKREFEAWQASQADKLPAEASQQSVDSEPVAPPIPEPIPDDEVTPEVPLKPAKKKASKKKTTRKKASAKKGIIKKVFGGGE
jgi:type IV secretory pathway VirB10-like protein